ncbi:MAG TPA: type I restriction endonuclease subunit R [Candidatus Syntrophoarchaeum butanivorans]|uniref:type I site-specific deoxyribonuclease n=1 Tax=Candidatus Syntropharchaeum butanivorans TaxID=1839936 RepID=A0A1F2P4G3_9EURY|nr:MAG: type I site-specific deoxyribonuclease, HsdR family [Candidatus Syntrophoarchaeum butanivorans]HEC57421.1 type I restriction endonuclease subunit R [Candidatus Syntrophoarchaeum butanivorans]
MIDEQTLEKATMDWLKDLGYEVAFGPDISPGGERQERDNHSDVILLERLRYSLERINRKVPDEAIEEAIHRILNISSPNIENANREFHLMLRNGVRVEIEKDGERRGEIIWLFDFDNPSNNDWLAVNQFRVIEGEHNRVPDIVVFVNGIPLAVIELKNPLDVNATLVKAYNQLQTYKREIPTLFYYNEVLVLSDGSEAKHGTITSPWERFAPWRTIDLSDPPYHMNELEVLLRGIFDKSRFLELVRDFILFVNTGKCWQKLMAMYHQYHAVKAVLDSSVKVVKSDDKRIGVIWHTQGSGKSLTMIFYVSKLLVHPELGNPTIVVLTDRNDLDNQLYERFSEAKDLLPEPVQAESVEDLKEKLRVPAGGIIFSTVQKFKPEKDEVGRIMKFPLLSNRENIIVIADEAHRSHYNFLTGYARHIRDALPNAAFIGFTGTPIELGDKSTAQVFGDTISVYDIQSSIMDKATVPIYYESRLVKLDLPDYSKEFLDEKFEEITELEEFEFKEKLKKRWSRLEKLVGTEKRLKTIARDIVEHFERRVSAIEGKAMIVCMSRRICVEMYRLITELRPEWHSEDDNSGVIKVIMTGSASDPPEFQSHIRNKTRREHIKKRFVNPDDPLKIVIVRDMWLTGFDNPCLHTMYIDKHMKGHTLMQAIARVNRVFRDKPSGLIVDYIGIAEPLKRAVMIYTQRGYGDVAVPIDEALDVLKEKYEVVKSFFHEIDYSNWRNIDPSSQIQLLQFAHDLVVENDERKKDFLKAMVELNKAFAIAAPHEEAMKIADDIAFFQMVRKRVIKVSPPSTKPVEVYEAAIRQLISEAVVVKDVVDILSESEIKHPDISILSDEFLDEIMRIKFPNLRIEILRRLIEGEIRVRMRKNAIRYRPFKEMLEKTIKSYHNRLISSTEVVLRLIEIAKEINRSAKEGELLGLNDEELAFYDALSQGRDTLIGDDELKEIVRELVETIKGNITIDWNNHEMTKARVRASVRRLLRKRGFEPSKQDWLVNSIMQQAEALYGYG